MIRVQFTWLGELSFGVYLVVCLGCVAATLLDLETLFLPCSLLMDVVTCFIVVIYITVMFNYYWKPCNTLLCCVYYWIWLLYNPLLCCVYCWIWLLKTLYHTSMLCLFLNSKTLYSWLLYYWIRWLLCNLFWGCVSK